MFDFLSGIDLNMVFSGASFVIGGIVVFMLKTISKNTKNTIDDKIVEALDAWYKQHRDVINKDKK